ncbi:MAG: hypothetical protein ABI639_09325 [Thermoanaerobaculia bacterium]
MGVAEVARRPALPAAALALLLAGGCASGGAAKPAALPPVSEVPDDAGKAKPDAEEPVATPKPPTIVVIDSGADTREKAPRNLADAAREERERRARAGKPVAVLDNKNIASFSQGQKLTVATDGTASPESKTAAATSAEIAALDQAAKDESYWRNRGLEIRKHWRESFDRIGDLEAKTEELRRRFYAADDPYLRDSQIKPEWDHAIEDLEAARLEVDHSESDLEHFLDEGRQAGALPGWLRDGSDLEPEPAPKKAKAAEPSEPIEVQESPGPP